MDLIGTMNLLDMFNFCNKEQKSGSTAIKRPQCEEIGIGLK